MNLKCLFCLLISTASWNCFSQNSFSSFRKLSRPEKFWVFAHPFVAKKALRMTRIAIATADSISRTTILDGDPAGGQVDAFRHCYWMALLITKMNPKKALKLGKAHEKGNYLEFKAGKLEQGILPDSVSSAMDIYNNEIGAGIGKFWFSTVSPLEIQLHVIAKIKNGDLLVIKKNKSGNYLNCEGEIINMEKWKGKWGIAKCLVKSNYH